MGNSPEPVHFNRLRQNSPAPADTGSTTLQTKLPRAIWFDNFSRRFSLPE